MRILLDTEAMLWAIEKDARLSPRAETAILTAEDVFVSPVNFFEVAIKLKISRKIRFSRPVVDLITAAHESGFVWLPISEKHLSAYDSLPFHEQYRDPRSVDTVRPYDSGNGTSQCTDHSVVRPQLFAVQRPC